MAKLNELDIRKAKRAISEIARAQGISEEQVRADMEEAMLAGYNNPDPLAREEWANSPFAERVPTVEEFIAWMITRIKREGMN